MTLVPIGRLIGDLAHSGPDKLAITCGDDVITRLELEVRTNRLARAYQALGVAYGDRVTIGLSNSIGFYEACIAAWKLGATPQPISWRLPERERSEIISLAKPALVVGIRDADRALPCVPPDFTPDTALSSDPLPDVVSPSLKTMTSGGSTGRPKLIEVTDTGQFDTDRRPMGMQPLQTNLVSGPLYHNAPFASTLGLFLGQHLVVLPRFDAEAALDAITRYQVNWLQLVPTMMSRMWRAWKADPSRYDLSSIQQLWHMAAPCPAWLKQAWIDMLAPEKVFELYGGTEGQMVTVISGTEWVTHRGSVGRPADGDIRVVDEDGNDVAAGVVGEVYLRREGSGGPRYRYIGATARTLPGGWESLGDLGHVDAEGYLYLSDRRTDLILSGGANIYPAEVESVLSEHPGVLSCVVVGLPDDDLGHRVHAIVEGADDLSEDALRSFVSERLVRYKVPRSFHFVDVPLRNEAGKVNRGLIREREVARLADDTASAGSAT
jgi:bile acid-coenzyme A ligase